MFVSPEFSRNRSFNLLLFFFFFIRADQKMLGIVRQKVNSGSAVSFLQLFVKLFIRVNLIVSMASMFVFLDVEAVPADDTTYSNGV